MRTLAVGAALLLAGCGLLGTSTSDRLVRGDEGRSITVGEAEQRTKNFADRYVQLVSDAVDHVKDGTQDLRARRQAHLLKLQSASSAWDIVTSSHPLQEMLDLFVQTELQQIIWDREGLAAKTFGADGARVVESLRSARDEIYALARRALPDKRIEEIRAMVEGWRKKNPAVEGTGTFIRFGPYLNAPGADLVSQVLTGFGLLNSINPLDPAAKQVERVGETADDAFYMSKRFPMLLRWQTEAATMDVLTTLDAADVEKSIKAGDSLLRSATETARAAQGAIEAAAKLTNAEGSPKKEGPPGRPFDIREYEATAARVAETARAARDLLVEADSFAASPALTARAQQMGAYVNELATRIFTLALLLLVAFFALLTLYRLVARRKA